MIQRWQLIDMRHEPNEKTVYDDLDAARNAAEAIVGNNSAANPAPCMYMYGPGDGTTTVMLRPHFEFIAEMRNFNARNKVKGDVK